MENQQDRVEKLVTALIDGRLSEDEWVELHQLLKSSVDFRSYYREQMNVHAQIEWLLRAEDVGEGMSFDGGVPKEEPSERVGRFKFPAAAAIAALLVVSAVLLTSWFYRGGQTGEKDAGPIIAGLSGAHWDIGSSSPELGEFLENQTYSLVEGFLHLDVGQGVNVYIEGPCQFEPVSNMLLKVHTGRVNVEVTEKEGHGFTIWTPVGEFVDLGTSFGVGVGRDRLNNAVVMSEVFQGEVKLKPHLSVDEAEEVLLEGDVRTLTGARSRVDVSYLLDDRPARLKFSRYGETEEIQRYKKQDAYNLALGRSVGGYSHYSGKQGDVFPLENITDGRVNDTGVPGDWSFWANPNESPTTGFVIDLGELTSVDCLQFLNTRNRHYGDRGMRDFRISVGDENRKFREIGYGKLSRIEEVLSADSPPPVETFVFAPVEMRYLKVEVLSFYAFPGKVGSAGLNELRIFGASTPLRIKEELTANAQSLAEAPPNDGNIALGASVESGAVLHDRFSADRVTDGMITDGPLSGGDYSCWLAPDDSAGELTLDLGKVSVLDRIEIQNTWNSRHQNRGTKNYRVLLSKDGEKFEEVVAGNMARWPKGRAPFVVISLKEGIAARYVKFIADSYRGQGAGLSEICVYPVVAPTE